MGREGEGGIPLQNDVFVEADVDTGIGQRREIVGAEGIEPFGVDFGGAVAAHQLIFKENAYFRYHWCAIGMARGGNLDTGQEIFFAIGTELSDGQLAAGDDDRFPQIFEHKTERRGGESHCVGAVQKHKTIVSIVVLGNQFHHPPPILRFHVGRVDGRAKGDGVYPVMETLKFGHKIADMLPVEGFESTGGRIFHHADGTACVDDENFGR